MCSWVRPDGSRFVVGELPGGGPSTAADEADAERLRAFEDPGGRRVLTSLELRRPTL